VSAPAEGELNLRLASLLDAGTWLGSATVAIGLAMTPGTRIVLAGIGIFLALPVLRVAAMLIAFARRRDYRPALVAGLVLAVIAAGIAFGASV
jgi:uncharacterized membrane protein